MMSSQKLKLFQSNILFYLLIIININTIPKHIFFYFSVKEELRYICEICNKVFSRKVTLTKHKELHEKTVNGMESDESDEIKFITPRKKPYLRENKFVKYNDDINTFFIDDEF